ncbi:MAG: gluconate 2-dehydrogenase subunit 3 family protein [Myxococcota bacterium]|nr:gluconate 2-dehydrogenase subunit 3 family protein [Myxococcota bacterium]
MDVSRRNLLKLGLGGAALLSVGGVGLALRPTVLVQPRSGLRALDQQTYSILAAMAERIVPQQEGFPRASDVGVADKLDTLLWAMHPADVRELRQGLLLVENALAGLVLDGRWSSFTGSPPEVQDQALEALRTSWIPLRRSLYRAIYGLVSGTYWSQPGLYALAGYGGPPEFGAGQSKIPSRPPVERRSMEPPGPLERTTPSQEEMP